MADASIAALPPKPRGFFPLWAAVGVALVWTAVHDLELSFEALLYGIDDTAEYLGRYRAPDFAGLPKMLTLMAHTLATAHWGAALSIANAFVVAPYASHPSRRARSRRTASRTALPANSST